LVQLEWLNICIPFLGINVEIMEMLKKGNNLVKFQEQKYPSTLWKKALI
jgi:hypothetical protein